MQNINQIKSRNAVAKLAFIYNKHQSVVKQAVEPVIIATALALILISVAVSIIYDNSLASNESFMRIAVAILLLSQLTFYKIIGK